MDILINRRRFRASVAAEPYVPGPYEIAYMTQDYLFSYGPTGYNSPDGVAVSTDETHMFVADNSGDIFQFTMTTPGDLSTASLVGSYDAKVLDLTGNLRGIYIKDSTTIFVSDSAGKIHEYALSVAWTITSASKARTLDFSTLTGSGASLNFIAFKSDGTKLYSGGTLNDTLYQISLSSAWNISTATDDGVSLVIANNPEGGISFNADGTRFFVSLNATDQVAEFSLASAYADISGATLTGNVLSGTDLQTRGHCFNADGTALYLCGSTNDTIERFTLPA